MPLSNTSHYTVLMRYECAFTLNSCGFNCGFYSDNNFYAIKWEATRLLKKTKRRSRRAKLIMFKKIHKNTNAPL